MAEIVFSRDAARQIEDIRSYYDSMDERAAQRANAALFSSFDRLLKRPELGRPAIGRAGMRELVIPFGKTGFVVLYRTSTDDGQIVILAVRHQRQAGYNIEG